MMSFCSLVKDLLPSYLEHLTSPETDAAVSAHLETCADCRAAKAAMEAALPLETAPPSAMNVFKKLRRQQWIGAALSALIALLCLYGLYGLEYPFDLTNTAQIEAALDHRIQLESRFRTVETEVLESVPVKNRVFVLYRLGPEEAHLGHGVAQFERGILGKYRLRASARSTWPLNTYGTVKIGRQHYLLISGVNDPIGADTFKIFADYRPPAYADEPVLDIAAAQPVYQGKTAKELLLLEPITVEQAQHSYWPWGAVYYDADGREVDSRTIAESYGYDGSINGSQCGDGYAPTELYVWSTLVLLLGVVFIRYFLKP